MITAEQLEAIPPFPGLLRVAVAEGAEPLAEVQRQVRIDLVGELIEHAKDTVTT
jgi:hypothetical protein